MQTPRSAAASSGANNATAIQGSRLPDLVFIVRVLPPKATTAGIDAEKDETRVWNLGGQEPGHWNLPRKLATELCSA